jgi:hypothetical protein
MDSVTITNQGSKVIYVDCLWSPQSESRIRLSSRASQTVYLAYEWIGHIRKVSEAQSDPGRYAFIQFCFASLETLGCRMSLMESL